MGLTRHKSSKL